MMMHSSLVFSDLTIDSRLNLHGLNFCTKMMAEFFNFNKYWKLIQAKSFNLHFNRFMAFYFINRVVLHAVFKTSLSAF